MKSKISRTFLSLAVIAGVVVSLAGCTTTTTPSPSPSPSISPSASPVKIPYLTTAPTRTAVTNKDIILSTTTSTRDSGLLDVLIPIFQNQTGYTVKTVAVGTGAALAMGRQGNADVILAHDYVNEIQFMKDGYGINRQLVMHNDFIIIGPTSDPAGVKNATSATDAFKKIAAANATFVSRGDASGTNAQELRIWNATGIDVTTKPVPSWYITTGQAMGATLGITWDKNGYTLSDRATYLASQKAYPLTILYQGDPSLLNVYHVIQVNPAKFPNLNINVAGAKALDDFMIAPDTQKLISQFGIAQYGQALFFPDYGKTEAQLGLPDASPSPSPSVAPTASPAH